MRTLAFNGTGARESGTADGLGHRRVGVMVGAALVALSAYGGAIGLSTGVLAIGDELNQRLPWNSPVLGGLLLALIVAVPFTAVAVAAWRRSESVDAAAFGAGALLVGWIVGELAFIREFSFFHPTYILVGVLFMLAGRDAVPGRRALSGRTSTRRSSSVRVVVAARQGSLHRSDR